MTTAVVYFLMAFGLCIGFLMGWMVGKGAAMEDYELICPKDGEELVDGECPKCGWRKGQ